MSWFPTLRPVSNAGGHWVSDFQRKLVEWEQSGGARSAV